MTSFQYNTQTSPRHAVVIQQLYDRGTPVGLGKSQFCIFTYGKIGSPGQIFKFDYRESAEFIVTRSLEIAIDHDVFLSTVRRIDSNDEVNPNYLVEGTKIFNNFPIVTSPEDGKTYGEESI